MTTIAYKDGVFAYDSRRCSGSTIVDDEFNKCLEANNVMFFITGAVCDAKKLIAGYFGEAVEGIVECAALVFDSGTVALIGWNQDSGVWVDALPIMKPYCIGSGADHAWTALDMGASAVQAVEMAMKRDVSTGGRVRTFKIPGFEPDRAMLDYPVED